MDDLFERCGELAQKLSSGDEEGFRNALILLINDLNRDGVLYPPLVNHLIRISGLYPYIDEETASFDDLLVKDLFVVDVGGGESKTLHRDQSFLLKQLLSGESLVVSAPTSFGKSFVIDTLIGIKRPTNVMIIVPTISLADETRRRLNKKFAKEYKIITTSNVSFGEKNIFVFPQERGLGYVPKIDNLDLFIIDEFYKSGYQYEEGRYVPLIKLITRLKDKAKQCYFLAPNIDSVHNNPFTKGMKFIAFDLKTVFLNFHDEYKTLKKGAKARFAKLLEILNKCKDQKTLIYTQHPYLLKRLAQKLVKCRKEIPRDSLLSEFSDWFSQNYASDNVVTEAAKKGIVVHHGQLHRAIAQIAVKLFDSCDKCNLLLSTSSLIEGVNTSAENVVLWSNRNGQRPLNAFTYKNIAGRAGRMFHYFVGNVYNLVEPPKEEKSHLEIKINNDELYGFSDEHSEQFLSEDQIKAIKTKGKGIVDKYGGAFYRKVFVENELAYITPEMLDDVVRTMGMWNGLHLIEQLVTQDISKCKIQFQIILGHYNRKREKNKYKDQLLNVLVRLGNIWTTPMKEFISELQTMGIDITDYFKIERDISFSLVSYLQDINLIYSALHGDGLSLIPLTTKLSTGFLPPRVYELEEYGLPRMLSRKIQDAGIINLETESPLEDIINRFRFIGKDAVINAVSCLHKFDYFILDYFYDGIRK